MGIAGFMNNIGPALANPLIMDQFTADPTARVFEGKIYVYPRDIKAAGSFKVSRTGFVMPDYHVFVRQSDGLERSRHDHFANGCGLGGPQCPMPCVAPDCVYKDSKYYFYFQRRKARRNGRAATRKKRPEFQWWCGCG